MTPKRWQRLRAAIQAALDTTAEKHEDVLARECCYDRELLSAGRAAVAVLAPRVERSARGTPFLTPELWQRVRAAIETAALDAEADKREEVLLQLCADDSELLSEARAILRFAQNTGFLEGSQVLALVPFKNLNRDPEADWLGAGIVEALASDLARVTGLKLVPRNRVAHALAALGTAPAGPTARDVDLGLALGCDWVLSGAYQTADAALRITAHLTEVSTRRLVASEELDGTLDDAFALQDQLARAVLARLGLDSPTAPP